MLTDFFVAPAEDATALSVDHMRTPNYAAKYLDNGALAALWRAMDANSNYESLEGEDYLVAAASPEGPWIFDLPRKTTFLLANFNETEQAAIAERWRKQRICLSTNYLAPNSWSQSNSCMTWPPPPILRG